MVLTILPFYSIMCKFHKAIFDFSQNLTNAFYIINCEFVTETNFQMNCGISCNMAVIIRDAGDTGDSGHAFEAQLLV